MRHRRRGLAVLIGLTALLMPPAPAAADDGHADHAPDLVRAATVGAASVTAGRSHSCAITSIGAVYCWGSNAHGQLGAGSTASSSGTAVEATGTGRLTGIAVQVDAGAAHTCAIDTNGLAYCWGENTAGQLGTGDTVDADKPVQVDALTDRTLVEITTGEDHSCAVDEDGTAWCWGDDAHGQLGAPGLTGSSATPVQVSTATGMSDPVVDIAAGGDTTCAVTSTGKAYCWGQGDHGEVGDGASLDRSEPVAVDTAGTIRQVAVGEARSCAMDSAGTAFCWGDAIGARPVPVPGVRFSQVVAGGGHFCGLDRDKAAYCWGTNTDGEVGDGSTTDRPDPVAVAAGVKLWDIEAGDRHSCALDDSGTAYCWGADDAGQLGDGNSGPSAVPVRVQGLPRPPAAVTGLTVTALDGGLRASWTAAADFGTGTFTSYLAVTSSFEATCTVTAPGGTGCDLRGLTGGQTYDVAVLTLTSDGSGLSSFATGAPIKVVPPVRPGAQPGQGLPITGPALTTGALLTGVGVALLLLTAGERRRARRRALPAPPA